MPEANQERLDALLAEAVERHLAGQTPDIDALALAHPELADEIRRRWQDLRKVRDPLGPLLQTAAAETLSPGAWVGNFRLVREIGRGGMGVVYEAQQREPHRAVAVKIIRGGTYLDEHAVRMFQREAAALARLKHPAIASIYEAGRTDDGRHFFAMELVQGIPLIEYVRRSDFRLRQRLELFGKVCEGVNYAHQRGVIHRDLKPGNILIDDQGNPKILDFGLARITDADVNVTTQATDSGRIQGTLPYMSPEQARSDAAEIDVRSDVYALGVILYELLTGRLPHDLTRVAIPEAVRVICEDAPLRPGTINRTLRGDLETVVLKALEKDPSRRYQSVAGLTDDVSRFLTNQPILARPPSAAYQLRKFVTRHKVGAAFAASLLCCLSALGIVMSIMSVKLAHERDQAEQARAAALVAEQQAKEDRDAQARERQRAEKAEQEAKTEAQTAKEVTGFLVSIFAVADPNIARGKKITAREILDMGADRALKEMNNRPVIQARLLNGIGQIYTNLGLYERAEPLLERAKEISRESLGDEHPSVAESLDNLAALRYRQGMYGDAEELYLRSLTIIENAFGLNHPAASPPVFNLVSVYIAEGKYDETESLLKRLLEVQEATSEPGHTKLAQTLHSLASVYEMWGKQTEARLVLKRIFAINDKLGAADDLDQILNAMSLGDSYCAQGSYNEAEPHFTWVLSRAEETLGSDHPEVGRFLRILGYVYSNLNRPDEAKAAYERSLSISQKAFGENHPEVAESLEELADFYHGQGEDDQAQLLYERTLAILEKIFGPNHARIGRTLNKLAISYQERDKYSQAEQHYRRALAVREKALGPNHPDVAATIHMLATCLHAQGQSDRAVPLFNRALEIEERALSPEAPDTVSSLEGLACAYQALAKYDEAVTLYRRALTIKERTLGPDHPDVADTLESMATVSQGQAKYDDAESLYKRATAIRQRALGPDHPEVAASLRELALLYQTQGESARAEPLYRESLRIQPASLEEQDDVAVDTQSLLGACLVDLRRFDEAEPLLVGSYVLIGTSTGLERERRIAALKRIIRLYEAWNKPEKATEYRRMLQEVKEAASAVTSAPAAD